ncbi:bifunctional arginine demethylase and lysyl-hydroxylase JMJD6 [Cotesia typhae]|uniref:bifunctional arginine demethylase and lysyl-hydroxylase JMJD6 n=1 Tax=Cotesia typhae TaxID=2053667 RepID=UPI003D694E71
MFICESCPRFVEDASNSHSVSSTGYRCGTAMAKDRPENFENRVDTAKKELLLIVKKIDGLCLTTKAAKSWNVYNQLRGSMVKFSVKRKHIFLLGFLAWIFYYFVKSHFSDLQFQKCLIEPPDIFQKIFRPAEDCSMCQSIQQVEKLANIDPDFFEQRYAYSGKPVVITDATVNWTAAQLFSFSFFKSLYHGRAANCQFFPYKTGFKSLQDVFNMSEDRILLKPGSEPWYVGWSNCDEKIGSILRQHYSRLYFLPTTAESEKTDWIFMGSPGYGAPMHVDDVDHPSWQAQLKGSKLWILEPPRECYFSCKKLQVVVEPGEIIILDTNRWYHQTKIISSELSITIGAEYD